MTSRTLLAVYCLLLSALHVSAQEDIERQNDTIQAILEKSNDAYDVHNYKDVIEYGAELIKKGKEYDSNLSKFLGYDIIGGAYLELEDTLQGRIYSEKALEIARISELDSLIAWGTMNLGILYAARPQTFTKAVAFFEESIAINEKNNELGQVYLTLINLAWVHLDYGDANKALIALNRAQDIGERSNIEPAEENYTRFLVGRYHLLKKDYSQAIEILKVAAEVAERDSLTDTAIAAYGELNVAYAAINDYQNAFKSLSSFNNHRNKVYSEKKNTEAEKARAKFEIEQTQMNLKAALREKQYSQELVSKSKSLTTIFIVATIILGFALLGFYLFFNTRKKYIRQLKTNNRELVKAKEKAEKLSKIKTRFLSTVSHELRTPLYGVIGISTLLRENKKFAAHKDDLDSLKFSADYLLALVNDVLLLSKMDAEAIHFSERPFKLDFLLHNIIRSFEFILQKNNNILHLDIDKAIPNRLIGDSIRLSQILINLIGNAAKFTQEGNIWLTLVLLNNSEKDVYKIRFTVRDDGLGIAADKQQMIFDEFSQIEHENHDYKGTGLGLTIVKRLLKLYKSKIDLVSAPGEGSKFSFSLNIKKDTSVTPIGLPPRKGEFYLAENFSQITARILIVDDNKINQKITQKILKKYHIRSSLASDGQQAVSMNKSQKFDMILMDINMPKVNGMEAAVMIREFDQEIPIIALTAVELDEMRDAILNSGINDIIHKPYDVREFLNIVLKYLPSRTKKLPE